LCRDTPKAAANGIIFTTAQMFEEISEFLSDRRNIIVMVDEAHRSQLINERVDSKAGHPEILGAFYQCEPAECDMHRLHGDSHFQQRPFNY
jgi:hypothetical protein